MADSGFLYSRLMSSAVLTDALATRHRRIIVAAAIGNLLEWYDFFVYGVLAVTIAKLFFPSTNELTSLLLALVTYGGGVAIRPIGAVIMGIYADRVGRKAALCASMAIMGFGTALIAAMPTYETIGPAAPLLLVFARLLQGFSGAGEFGGATALLVESAPSRWRGLYGSLNDLGAQVGFLLAALVVMIVTLNMTPPEIEAGGWRLPFVLGLAILPLALYIRTQLQEPDLAPVSQISVEDGPPDATSSGSERVLVASGILLLYVVAGNVLFVYMPTFAVHDLALSSSSALLSTVLATCAMAIATPIAAAASDRIGRKPLLLLGVIGYLLLAHLGFMILETWPRFGTLLTVQSAFGLLTALYAGPLRATVAELFRRGVRATSAGLANGLTVMVGTLGPALASWLIATTGDTSAPALIVVAAAVCSGFALLRFRDRYRDPLR